VDVRENTPLLPSTSNMDNSNSTSFLNSFEVGSDMVNSNNGNNNLRVPTTSAGIFRPRDIVSTPQTAVSKRTKISTNKLPMKQPPTVMMSSVIAASSAYTPVVVDEDTKKMKLKVIH
jgi:hypothetical protein